MPQVTIGQLKSRFETSKAIVDRIIDINEENLGETEESVLGALRELEELKDALFYKEEKIKAENQKYKGFAFESLCIRDKVAVRRSADVEKILELQSELKSYDLMIRYLRMREEVGAGSNVLDGIFRNIDYDRLEFFCFFLLEATLDEGMNERFFELKQETEKRLSEAYEHALAENDTAGVRAIYKASFYLNKGYPLVKIFINNIEILRAPFFVSKAEDPAVLDLDFHKPDFKFFEFLDRVRETYEKDLMGIEDIFFDASDVLLQINQRIFDDILSSNLDTFLAAKDPFVFLLNLKNAYASVKDLCEHIQSLHPVFYTVKTLDDLFSPYISLVHTKEVLAFDALFDTLVAKKESARHYVLLGERVSPEYSDEKAFKKLLAFFDAIVERWCLFKQQGQSNYFACFFKRFSEFVSNVESNFGDSEKLLLVRDLSYYYLVLRRFCKNAEVPEFGAFETFVTERIRFNFNARCRSSEREMKDIFGAMTASEYSSRHETSLTIKKIVHFLMSEHELAQQYIPGENSARFMCTVLNYVYVWFYRKILAFTFSAHEARILCNDAKLLLDFVKKRVPHMQPSFEYVWEVAQLIAVPQSDLRAFFSNVFEKIPDNQVKKILKCRSDYREIRDVLENVRF